MSPWIPPAALTGAIACLLTLSACSGDNAVQSDPEPAATSTAPAEPAPTCFGRAPTIAGTAGADTIEGTDQADVIVGLGGDDIVEALDGDDVVCGGTGRDRIKAGTGTDLVRGDAGSDWLHIGPQDGDRLIGDAGNDRLLATWQKRVGRRACADYTDSPVAIEVRGSGSIGPRVRGPGKDHVEVPCLIATPHGDSINPWTSNEPLVVLAGAGNDYVHGSSYGDRISAGPGYDQVWAGNGRDHVVGGDDKDVLQGQGGNDIAYGGDDTDHIDGGLGSDRVVDANGRLRGVDRLRGGPGGDLVRGEGQDGMDGGPGADRLVNLRARDARLVGGPGDDHLIARGGPSSRAELEGGDGNDVLVWRGPAPDTRNPYVDSSAACAAYRDAETGVNANLGLGVATGEGRDRLVGLACIKGTPFGDVLTGGPGNDVLLGGSGDDVIDLGAGRDHASGDAGSDRITGGPGDDEVNGRGGGDVIDGGDGNDTLRAGFMCDVGSSYGFGEVDALPVSIFGGPGDDYLQGDRGGDFLDGGAGVDEAFPGRPPGIDTLVNIQGEACR